MFSSYYDIGELRNYLIGKSEDEVTDLLGKPDTGGDTMWRYAKGTKDPDSQKITTLFVHFDGTGVCRKLDY